MNVGHLLSVIAIPKPTAVLCLHECFGMVICIAVHIETLLKLIWFVWNPHILLSDSKICAIVICALIYVSELIFHSRLLRTQWSTHLVHKVKSTKTFIHVENWCGRSLLLRARLHPFARTVVLSHALQCALYTKICYYYCW